MTESEKLYYDRRAPEYDDWYLGTGLFAARVRPRWHEELTSLQSVLRSLSIRSVLDVACGTGFLTQHLSGHVTGLDRSSSMLRIARARLPRAAVVQGDALCLPFGSRAFEVLMAAHFYGHLDVRARAQFLGEARRVAECLLVVDAAWREDVPLEQMQERVLQDGSRHSVYKRYFTAAQLVSELGAGRGGSRVLHSGEWFVTVII
jgi:demethylmenaquinone methyltransferase/2-methoxy-6-polyprenyl-1,4-benzoquinol methylase